MNYLDRFAKFPTSTKVLILIVILGLIGAFYFFVPFAKSSSRIASLKETNQQLVQTRDAKQAVADNIDKFREEVEQLEAELELAKQELPDEDEIPELLKQVDNLGRKIGLTWKSFEPQPVAPKGFYAEVPIRFEIEGDYHSVAVFFSKIGNLKRIVNIQNIQMSSPKEKNGKMILTVQGLAVTFKFIEGSVATPTPQ